MGHGYQKRDYEIVDYQLWTSPEFKRPFRGPQPARLEPGKYFSCLGGAQTFGCYTEMPYPSLLSEKLNIDVLNLGTAGAGPMFYLRGSAIMQLFNQSKFVILQVMSGRSESNSSLMSINGRAQLKRRSDKKVMDVERAYDELLNDMPNSDIKKIIAETRENYVSNMNKLLKDIECPKILFWFSERLPEYVEDYSNAKALFGKYPQLVNHEMIEELKPYADFFVFSVSNAGMPQKLTNRFTGEVPYVHKMHVGHPEIKRYNSYYPSPEMHQKVFESLIPVCNSILSKAN